MEAKIIKGAYGVEPSEKDEALLAERVEEWETHPGPRVGDFLDFDDGTRHRFSHDHGQEWGIQTSPLGGSFYLGLGYVSYSGGLQPCIKHHDLTATDEKRQGLFWFFHNDWRRASNGITVSVPCRVFTTPLTADHWKGGK